MCPFEPLPRDMKDWVLSQEGDKWSVKFDVRDPGGHLECDWLISRLVLIFCPPFGFSWKGACGQVYVFACCRSWC